MMIKSFGKSVKAEAGGSECRRVEEEEEASGVFLDRGRGGLKERGQGSETGQAVVTVLQDLVALVAARVPRRVTQGTAPVQEQLLLGRFGLGAPLGVTASCSHQQEEGSHISVTFISERLLVCTNIFIHTQFPHFFTRKFSKFSYLLQ